jgi:3-oxoacyl-[acyl-carrier protein] reductase
MMSSDRLVTLITGARSGIGKFLAQHYVTKGHMVVGCSRGESDWTHESYSHLIADVSDEAAVQKLFLEVKSRFGKLDHLINNAGIASMNHSVLTPLSTVRDIYATNVLGTFLFCREAIRLMQKRKFGRIVNFSTVAAPLKLEGEAAYASSKAAVTNLSQILAKEYAAFGVTVNVVGPTPIQTDLIRNVPKPKIDEILKRQAIRRMGTFEDVANVTDFFLNKHSDFITGQVIYLGGV